VPVAQEAVTVPASVYSVLTVVAGADAGELAAPSADDVAVVDAASGTVPGEVADASTKDTARKPSPTADAAEAVHAVPRRKVRFMGQRLRSRGLRASQGRVKERPRCGRKPAPGG
jgi:hypothetical protein